MQTKGFGIDNGQLKDISAEEAFTLGYEFAEFSHSLAACRHEFVFMANVHNENRICATIHAVGRRFTADLCAPGWVKITVHARGDTEGAKK